MRPTCFIFSSPLILLIMVVSHFYRFASPITTVYMYAVLYLQSLIRIFENKRSLRRFVSASLENLRRCYADFPGNDYCFRVSSEPIIKVSGGSRVISSIFCLSLNLPIIGLTQHILVLYLIERWPTKWARAFNHLNVILFIFMPWIIPRFLLLFFFIVARAPLKKESATFLYYH